MIQEQEAALIISQEILTSGKLPLNSNKSKNIYYLFDAFTALLKKQAMIQNFRMLKHSLVVVEKIYVEGNAAVKNCIEQTIVFSFFDFIKMLHKEDRLKIHAMMPITIYSAYIKQVNTSGI